MTYANNVLTIEGLARDRGLTTVLENPAAPRPGGSNASALKSLPTAGIVGRSAAMLELFEAIERVAGTDASVLICGETGTGKELVARALHAGSRRRGGPLITVNCAALPRELVESELFGHERGAFTGAADRRIGRFELAAGGTIFLDEISEFSIDAQAKLLRVLQEHCVERVGGNTCIPLDVRVIAASNRDLAQMVAAGEFRADLYYRLNVYPIRVPPLRDRHGDIALLAEHLLNLHATNIGKRPRGISASSMRQLEQYCWPGNVRELENVIERMIIMCADGSLHCELPEPLADPLRVRHRGVDSAEDSNSSLDEVMRRHIARVLNHCGGTIEGKRGAAAILGLKPSTLRYRIRQLGVNRQPEA